MFLVKMITEKFHKTASSYHKKILCLYYMFDIHHKITIYKKTAAIAVFL